MVPRDINNREGRVQYGLALLHLYGAVIAVWALSVHLGAVMYHWNRRKGL